MPRYYFHFLWPDDAVFDQEGLELDCYEAAYHRACRLVHQVRSRFPASDEDWWIEITDGSGTLITILHWQWCPELISRSFGPNFRAQLNGRRAAVLQSEANSCAARNLGNVARSSGCRLAPVRRHLKGLNNQCRQPGPARAA
jgi:hypothetical protein